MKKAALLSMQKIHFSLPSALKPLNLWYNDKHSEMPKIEDIYFFEVNTKYISSNVMKISINSST